MGGWHIYDSKYSRSEYLWNFEYSNGGKMGPSSEHSKAQCPAIDCRSPHENRALILCILRRCVFCITFAVFGCGLCNRAPVAATQKYEGVAFGRWKSPHSYHINACEIEVITCQRHRLFLSGLCISTSLFPSLFCTWAVLFIFFLCNCFGF